VKYFSIISNIVLAIAIIVLYVLHFSSPGHGDESREHKTDSLALPSDLAIAYVLEDSLLSKYDYFLELAKDLEKKRTDMENDYTLKAQGLQKEIEAFQRTAGNMTMLNDAYNTPSDITAPATSGDSDNPNQ
jgi:outer membrane protein